MMFLKGIIKGIEWAFISPDHKGPQLFLGGYVIRVGGHEKVNFTQFGRRFGLDT